MPGINGFIRRWTTAWSRQASCHSVWSFRARTRESTALEMHYVEERPKVSFSYTCRFFLHAALCPNFGVFLDSLSHRREEVSVGSDGGLPEGGELGEVVHWGLTLLWNFSSTKSVHFSQSYGVFQKLDQQSSFSWTSFVRLFFSISLFSDLF